jgi:hypothetical protein
MKGLAAVPSITDLAAAYRRLQTPGEVIDEATLAHWSQWARLDPRLAEQLVALMALHWRSWDALALQALLKVEPWPGALGVLGEHAASMMAKTERQLFKAWLALTMTGLPHGPGELFFMGTMKFGGPRMRAEAEQATKPYLRWGYLGREPLRNKASALESQTQMSPSRRRQVLSALRGRQRRITVQDYMDALGGAVSRRVAQKDLAHCTSLRSRGRTRGRVYVPRRAKTAR